MNQKTVKLLKKYSQLSGFPWRRFKAEYLSLSSLERRKYKLQRKKEIDAYA